MDGRTDLSKLLGPEGKVDSTEKSVKICSEPPFGGGLAKGFEKWDPQKCQNFISSEIMKLNKRGARRADTIEK